MSFLPGLWIALSAALIALTFTKQTRFYEVAIIGVWGISTGALLAGVATLNGLSLGTLWNLVF